jgi:hypothetical protein
MLGMGVFLSVAVCCDLLMAGHCARVFPAVADPATQRGLLKYATGRIRRGGFAAPAARDGKKIAGVDDTGLMFRYVFASVPDKLSTNRRFVA